MLEEKMVNTSIASKISVVVPVFNSETTLKELTYRIIETLDTMKLDHEIIFVDDGSRDGSWEVLKAIKSENDSVRIIRLMKNFGQHNALMCAFNHVTGEYIVTLDDDLQNPPEEIPKIYEKIVEGYDIVYGEYTLKKHNKFRNLGSGAIQLFYRKIFNVKHNLTAFRIIHRRLIDAIISYNLNYTFIDGLIAWYTSNIGYVQVTHHARERNHSGYSLRKLLSLSLNMMTNFSLVPLQMASMLGISLSLFGFILALYFFVKKIIVGVPISGYTSLIISITIFSGVQLLTIGVIGEYLGRVHLNINKKPQYKIRENIV